MVDRNVNQSLPHPITEPERAAFARDGAVCIRGLFDAEWVEVLRTKVAEARAEPGLHTQVHSMPGEAGGMFLDYRTSERMPSFRSFLTEGPGAEVAARLLDSDRINLHADNIFEKDPGTSKGTPWHHDQPTLNVDGHKVCNIWVALDPIPRDGCLELVAGSHRWGRWFQGILRLQADPSSPFEPIPDIDARRDAYEFLAWDMAPGDCIVFHSLALHTAPGNSTARPRRVVGAILLGDDATWGDRASYMNPPLTGHGLAPGDPMDCAYFPRIWPRPARQSEPNPASA